MQKLTASEIKFLLILSTVQFVNILDFMMVMPLGPDFSTQLGIDPSHLGLIAGSYTFSAAICGLISALFLDRFGRKKALLTCIFGLSLGTFLCGFANHFHSLIFARLVAGFFGGPATSLTMALVADYISPEKRGRAMGFVMGSFALSSILGVPFGLEIARLFGWRMPFFVVGFLALLAILFGFVWLPRSDSHLKLLKPFNQTLSDFGFLLRDSTSLYSYLTVFLIMFSSFSIIPNIATYVQFNGQLPREQMGMMYMAGGLFSLLAMQVSGRFIDRFGIFRVVLIDSFVLVGTQVLAFYFYRPMIPALPCFILFMSCMSVRGIAVQTVVSKIPKPELRARYQSLQSFVQHMASSLGAMLGSLVLLTDASGALLRFDWIVGAAAILTLLVLPVFRYRLPMG